MATISPDGRWEWKGGKWVLRSKFADLNVDVEADFGEEESSVDEISAKADPEIEQYKGIESSLIGDMQIIGIDRLFSQLSFLAPVANMEVIASCKKAFDDMMEDSRENYVPVDTGELKASGETHVTPKPHRVVASYGANGAQNSKGAFVSEYALLVHEDLRFNHPNGGQAKYLEAPMLKHMPTIDAAAQQSTIVTVEKIESVELGNVFTEDVRSTRFIKGGFGAFRRMTRRNGKLVSSKFPGSR